MVACRSKAAEQICAANTCSSTVRWCAAANYQNHPKPPCQQYREELFRIAWQRELRSEGLVPANFLLNTKLLSCLPSTMFNKYLRKKTSQTDTHTGTRYVCYHDRHVAPAPLIQQPHCKRWKFRFRRTIGLTLATSCAARAAPSMGSIFILGSNLFVATPCPFRRRLHAAPNSTVKLKLLIFNLLVVRSTRANVRMCWCTEAIDNQAWRLIKKNQYTNHSSWCNYFLFIWFSWGKPCSGFVVALAQGLCFGNRFLYYLLHLCCLGCRVSGLYKVWGLGLEFRIYNPKPETLNPKPEPLNPKL